MIHMYSCWILQCAEASAWIIFSTLMTEGETDALTRGTGLNKPWGAVIRQTYIIIIMRERQPNRSKTLQAFQNPDLLGFSPWIWSVSSARERQRAFMIHTRAGYWHKFNIDSFIYIYISDTHPSFSIEKKSLTGTSWSHTLG